jgi:hypothetical protein
VSSKFCGHIFKEMTAIKRHLKSTKPLDSKIVKYAVGAGGGGGGERKKYCFV